MQQLLIFNQGDSAVVLDTNGGEAEEALVANGANMEDWPEDFGIYAKEYGLWIWEGEISEDGDTFEGKLREVNSAEMTNIRQHRSFAYGL